MPREVEDEVGPVADPGQQVEAKEEGQAERGQRLPLSIGVDRVGLDVGGVLEQSLDDVDRLPDPTW